MDVRRQKTEITVLKLFVQYAHTVLLQQKRTLLKRWIL